MSGGFGPPVPIVPTHHLASFDCGDPVLNDWLLERALENQVRGASRTYVVTNEGMVIAYYCLAAAAVPRTQATGRARRGMPEPIPAVVLGRLAVDLTQQGKGLGRILVRDALARALAAADVIGARMVIVHAASDAARAFYERLGFEPSPTDPMHLMVTMTDVRTATEGV